MSSGTKLGVWIDPLQVRLIPASEDDYAWTALPEKENLFTKQLSKHSIRAYMELCREVSKSFKATEPRNANTGALEGVVQV